MIPEDRSGIICRTCGSPLRDDAPLGGHCLACLLGAALDDEEEPGAGIDLFDQYRLTRHADGTPVELGRGAMGVTYKAFDINLHYPVTLKVIRERYLGDESAQPRFLREARAAASVRHPNVASVFHLGRTGENYFYAMEFVEGETLQNLIKRSGQLEVKLALEIATQVAAGLAAVHKQKLVHRDIKPSNIMVRMEDGDAVAVKIIDLGLAKSVNEPGSQTEISIPGDFAGTPGYASPEQFAGIGVDIRSDLYSLGVMLWEMVTGHGLFSGSPAEVMYQHQHAPLPLNQLEGVPQPVVALIERLLEKDPRRRIRTPAELLKIMPAITDAINAGRIITYQSSRQMLAGDFYAVTRGSPSQLGPKKISVAALPITGSDIFGREEDIAFLDDAWANPDINVATIVAWAGVGKSTLLNHWLRRMAAQQYRSAELVFGWSFYNQGSSEDSSSADKFLNAALTWFGDNDPRIGTAWEKGERLASLIAHRRTLLILDGLEPLQNARGPQEGRLHEPSLQALLRELAAFNSGLCVVTTRMPISDIIDHEHASAPRRDLEHLSSADGAKLLRTMGVKGHEAELRSASHEFDGHCLALTLLGSYLADAYSGDIRCRKEVSARLAHDKRQGLHARKVMESYQNWFGSGPELSVLCILGLFDRPASEKTLRALLKPPAVHDLTESLTDLMPTEWRTILSRLRRARLLAREDPHNPGQLDTHPLVREYFGEQLLTHKSEAWKECNRRLFEYYRALAPELPDTFMEMEPLFLAVICGCNAGLFHEALHDVYIPRIQRGNACFAANVLGARGALLSALVHFFQNRCWGSPVESGVEGQNLCAEDQLFILLQSALYLSVTRGTQAPEVRTCYERSQPLCHSLNRPQLLCLALIGEWRYSLVTERLSVTLRIAKRLYSVAQEQNDSALLIKAYMALAATLYYLGNFESARQYAISGVQILRSGDIKSGFDEVDAPEIACLCHKALCEWHFGEITSCNATSAEAISVAKTLNDKHGLAVALFHAAVLSYREHNLAEVERLASELIVLSTQQNFAHFLAVGNVIRGWARSASGDIAQGLSWIEDGMENLQASGSRFGMLSLIALKAEALHLADRTSEALEVINEAEALVEVFEGRWWCAELHRLRGVFLTKLGADEARIEEALCKAISIAKQQKSTSLATRAEATYAEYCCQKGGAAIAGTPKPTPRLGPEKVSIARLPVTGSDIFGREEDIAFLDDAWANPDVNVVTIVGWAGVGKSTLVNHWLRGMAAQDYRSAELVFGWCFHGKDIGGDSSSADEFLHAALAWFGDNDPRIATAWEKGERLASLIAHRRTLFILDGLEPWQTSHGPQEGRLREPSLQALLRQIATFNVGLCVVTTRLPVTGIADPSFAAAIILPLQELAAQRIRLTKVAQVERSH
jgi:tetratricopeptide (TPR) repeat protein